MRRISSVLSISLCQMVVLCESATGAAQETSRPPPSYEQQVVVVEQAPVQPLVSVPAPRNPRDRRSGFTFELSIGVGQQTIAADGSDSESAIGLAGLNLGIGGFINPDLAVLFRISGTNVSYDMSGIEVEVVSGVGAVVLQYWVGDIIKLEAGPGIAVVSAAASSGGVTLVEDDRGFGFLTAARVQMVQVGGHSLQLGVEYAPAFFDTSTVHNLGVTFGWQLL